MKNEQLSDVLIVGGGVIGLACAHALLKAGRGVTVLEQRRIGSGASHGNCGTITPSVLPLPAPGVIAKGLRWLLRPDAPLRIGPRMDLDLLRWLWSFARRCNERDFRVAARTKAELLCVSRALLSDLIRAEQLDCEFTENGTFYVHRDRRQLERAAADAELLAELGVRVAILNGTQAREREPALNDSVVGGHYFPGDASLRPDRFVAELARIVRRTGGLIHEETSVVGFERQGQRISSVITSKGNFRAREVVLALGAWSPGLSKDLGLKIPIQPGKGYSITFQAPTLSPTIPLFLKERSVCVTPLKNAVRVGSTMEFVGFDHSLNRRRLTALVRGAEEYLRCPLPTVVHEEWFGWRPMTPDDLPVLGRAPGFENLTFATGHGMLGMSLAAITGVLTAEVVSDRMPSYDLSSFSLTRFASQPALSA